MATLERSHAVFDATQWTLLSALRSGDERERARALDLLIERYWPPVYAFLRRSGRRREEAAEITQAFFAEVVLKRKLLEQADPERGHLRSLILTALRNFARDSHRRDKARPDARAAPLDRLPFEDAMAQRSGDTAEEAFERRWSLAVVDEAVARCESHFARTGRTAHWSVFDARVLAPARGVATPPPLSEVHAQHGFATPGDAAAAVQIVKKRMIALLHEVVAETVDSEADAAEEFGRVVATLG